jgi:hypothetical protein
MRTCRVCGCTDARPCAGGCEWITDDVDVCSACWETDVDSLAEEMAWFREAHGQISLKLSVEKFFELIGAVQLACRHPQFTGPTRNRVERIVRQCMSEMPREMTTFRAVVAQGWNQNLDQPV